MFGPTHYILQTRPLLDFRQTNRENRQQTREREREGERDSINDNIETQNTVNTHQYCSPTDQCFFPTQKMTQSCYLDPPAPTLSHNAGLITRSSCLTKKLDLVVTKPINRTSN